MNHSEKIKELIEAFLILPGVGRKTAERFVFHLLKTPPEKINRLSLALQHFNSQNFFCPNCHNLNDTATLCPICQNVNRDHQTICVVADIQDLFALESAHEFHGIYHVLGGVIDLTEGITPELLRGQELLKKIQNNNIKEIIFALNPDLAGESTILYLRNLLKNLPVKLSRLARGLPMGGDIEYADEITLTNAIQGRQEIK
ncbi:MAG: recombination mediator RecR [Patescibacteria group bacterium]